MKFLLVCNALCPSVNQKVYFVEQYQQIAMVPVMHKTLYHARIFCLRKEAIHVKLLVIMNSVIVYFMIIRVNANNYFYSFFCTFPAPTGPIIATNCPGVMFKLMFTKVLHV